MGKSSAADVFPSRLKEAREKRELSQSELAVKAGLQASAISHFEIGARHPSFANLRRLADALNISTDFLLGRTDEMTGVAKADIMFRDIGSLSDRDRDIIQKLAADMAGRHGGGRGRAR